MGAVRACMYEMRKTDSQHLIFDIRKSLQMRWLFMCRATYRFSSGRRPRVFIDTERSSMGKLFKGALCYI